MTDAPAPVAASTLILLRDSAVGPECFLMVRNRGMSFASGAWVFPGGKVDPQDHDPAWLDWIDGDEPDAMMRAARIASIRETFEEAGVLFARREGRLLDADAVAALLPYDASQPLLDVVRAQGLRLACDLLSPFARWVGPAFAPKRFDTYFFSALVPENQTARETSSETIDADWYLPRTLLEATKGAAEERYLMFPTRSNLERINQYATMAELLAHIDTIDVQPIRPELVIVDGVEMLRIRDDQGYPTIAVPRTSIPRG